MNTFVGWRAAAVLSTAAALRLEPWQAQKCGALSKVFDKFGPPMRVAGNGVEAGRGRNLDALAARLVPVTPTGLNDHGPTASGMLNCQLHGICYTDAALLAGGRVEGYWLLRREARLDAAFHYGSGDDDPTDGVHGTFDQLYPQGHAVDRAPQQLEPHARLDLGSRCVPARLMACWICPSRRLARRTGLRPEDL